MKNKIYISGKISGLELNEAKENFYSSIREITKRHIFGIIINPFNIEPIFGIKNWYCYMISDLFVLKKCSHIAMQKNWIESKGAVIEYFFA